MFLLIASIGVLAIQMCFVIDKEILAMQLLTLLMFLSGNVYICGKLSQRLTC